MDETTSFWNKTASELTVKDNMIMAVVVPAAAVAGIVVLSVATGVGVSMWDKFQTRRGKRQDKNTEESN